MQRIIIFLVCLLTITMAQEIGARYLIITHDDFYDAILPLAEWKHKKGMRTKIAKLTDIGSSAYQIKNYITDAYNNWQIKPEFILFVGAPNYLPWGQSSYPQSDNYYTNMDGNIYNEILSGRLTVHNTNEAQTVVNKILLYERTPYMEDSLWPINACLIVREDYDPDDSIYWSDINHAKNYMLQAGYNTIDTFCVAAGNNTYDVVQAVNDGRAFVLYRGSGLNNWSSPFNVNPDVTQNGAKLPIVLSITCCTIGTGASPAIAERWLLTGTPSIPRGGAGYFATTTVIMGGAYLRSATCKGFFDALFRDGKRTFGEACEGGRVNVYQLYGSSSEYRGFITLGDPEMNIWTDTPCSLIVTHPQVISVGATDVTVNVSRASDPSPVDGAFVCVIGKLDSTVYVVDTTDADGNAYFNVFPQIVGDTMYVTVTGNNLKPYEGTMFTTASSRYVGYLKSSIDDSLGGNNDGCINPGEEINLPMWVKNYGDSSAFGVTGVLSIDDIYTTVSDSLKSFGNVEAGDSAYTGEDGYNFMVATHCPDGHAINFELYCRDVLDSVWISYFDKQVHAPMLQFQEALISGGNGNNTFEPGETVTVVVTIKNQGSAASDSAAALLSSSSAYIGVIDSIGSFGPLEPGGTTDNGFDPFIVFSNVNTPQGAIIDFQMAVTAGYYVDTIPLSLVVGKKAYYIWNPDQTPASGENIHTILSNLGYSGDYGTTLAQDLQLYQSVFVCVGVWSNNYVIDAGSPESEALVDFLENHGGRMYLEGGDVWCYDPPTGYNFCPLFGINPDGDGSSDMGPVVGENNAFTAGMDFPYSGENNFMDHISPSGSGAFLIFHDGNDGYHCGVARDQDTYRTVGTSFELGLLDDGAPPSTRAALLDSIMHFFNISTGVAEQETHAEVDHVMFDVFPNPCRGRINIKYRLNRAGGTQMPVVNIKIYDVSGRLVRQFNHTMTRLSDHIICNGVDKSGKELAEGVYFVQFNTGDFSKTHKIVFLK